MIETLAEQKYPLETGGVLIGYRADESDFIVTHIVGPGPGAEHGRAGFRPDQDFHVREIARHFERSSGVHVYLGDWHTHPDAWTARPSLKDRATIKRIAMSPEARAPKPIMLIAAGEAAHWRPRAWAGRLRTYLSVWCRLYLVECVLREY